jgi:hypothetical protein
VFHKVFKGKRAFPRIFKILNEMKIVFTPDWFLEADVLIELFSFIILAAFFFISLRNYRISKNKNTLYLGIGFLFVAIAEIATILTKMILYYDAFFAQQIGHVLVTYTKSQPVDIFYYIGFFLHKFFTLAGLYIIYKIPSKKGTSGDVILAMFFLIISAYFSTSNSWYYLFHLTALILLAFILGNYYLIYRQNKSENTKTLIFAFSLLALSQLIFLLSTLHFFYALGQVVQLVSYLILLFLIISIARSCSKKTKSR